MFDNDARQYHFLQDSPCYNNKNDILIDITFFQEIKQRNEYK